MKFHQRFRKSLIFKWIFGSAILIPLQVTCFADPLISRKLMDLSLEDLSSLPIRAASLFPESDLTLASTVSQIDEIDWERSGAHRTNDAITHLPSTMILPHLFGGDAIVVRGYAQLLSIRGLATLIDGVPIDNFDSGTAQYNVINFNLGALRNIEMIRGPGSALYGSDAFHGVFSLNTFESAANNYTFSTDVGTNGYYQAALKDSRQLSDNIRSNVALSVSGQGDQYRHYAYTSPVDGSMRSANRSMQYDSKTAVVKFISDNNEDWALRWGFYWDSYDASEFPGFGRSLSGTKSALGATDWSGNDSRFAMTNLSVTRLFSQGISVQINSYYWNTSSNWSSYRPQASLTVGEVFQDHVNTRQGTEIVVKQTENSWHTQWLASIGTNSMQVKKANIATYAQDGSLTRNLPEVFSGLERRISDVFLQARTSFFNDKIQLIYGGRLDDYADFGLQRTPRVGVIFLPQPDVGIKLLYGEAFRAPVASEISGNATVKSNPDLQPETNRTTEFTLLKNTQHGRTEVTFFRNQWENGILAVPINDPKFRLEYDNVAKSSAKGVELSYKIELNPWLIDTSASYLTSVNDLTQVRYNAFPRIIFNAGLGYHFANGTALYINNRYFDNLSVGPTTSTIAHPLKLAPFWRTDVHMDKNMTENLKLSLNIRNIFNRNNYLPSLTSAEQGLPDEDLNFSLGIKYLF